jgi:hypothetical protein
LGHWLVIGGTKYFFFKDEKLSTGSVKIFYGRGAILTTQQYGRRIDTLGEKITSKK